MANKLYFTTSAIVFTVIAAAHLWRILLTLEVNFAGYEVPLWVSGAFVLIAGYLATRGFQAARKL